VARKNLSAGLLMYRKTTGGDLEVFLTHPGGPIFKNRDKGWWQIPKGNPEEGETYEEAASRELTEETGLKAPPVKQLIPLGSIKQKGGKTVHAWAFEGDTPDGWTLLSLMWHQEWPRKSGHFISYPEIDKAQFFPMEEAKEFILPSQIPLLERLESYLNTL
jgi:predicted NUDIX family NTP pyrophosphohydrolase